MNQLRRCAWAEGDPLMEAYHDTEWGVPVRNSRRLWETLMLEGFQAGPGACPPGSVTVGTERILAQGQERGGSDEDSS